MERVTLKKGQTVLFCILIAVSVLLNLGGSMLADSWKLPLWLDSLGTCISAYLGGPVCGAMVGVTYNLTSSMINGGGWQYALVSAAIGIMVGLCARKGSLTTMFGVLTAAMMVTVTVTVLATPLNLIINKGSVGNMWGDAVAGFLRERGLPQFLCTPVGQIYVEILDKILTLLILMCTLKINFFVAGKRLKRKGILPENAEEKTDPSGQAAVKTAALLLALSLALSGAAGSARAEDSDTEDRVIDFNDYVQTVYSSQNGLPCGEANDIAQTNDGILWVGTYAGLYRYNGREFRWMDGFESVRNVNCLYVDEEGRLWIGTNDNGLSILINDRIVNVVDQSNGLPANSVRSIIRCTDGYYYIGTTSSMQVLSLNYGLQRVNTLSEVLYADNTAADENGHVAAVTNDGRLYLLQNGQILSSRRLTESDGVFKSCTFTPDGILLAATSQNMIYRFDISDGWFRPDGSMECGDLKSIKDLSFLDSGELFVSADNGVGYFDADGVFSWINTNSFNNSVDNMLMDYQGNLWFTSSRLGLLRLAPSDFRDIYSAAGMSSNVVNTIVFWQGNYYFGTDKGLDAVDTACRNQVHNDLTEQLKGIRIRCMMVDSEDHLWICTYGNGLLEIDQNGTQYLYNQDNGSFGNRARVVKQLKDGTVLAAGDTGLSYIRNHEIEDTILYAEGKISSMILSLTEMPDGRIMAGTDGNGIAVLEDRQVKRMLTRKDGLSSEVILRTVLDEKTGGMFAVTSNGLCYMNPDESVWTVDNFPYFNNYDIWIREDTDDLFVMSSAGIYVINRAELLSGKTNLSYDLLDSRRGLTSSLTANAWTWLNRDTGELFLPCDTSVFVINTRRFGSTATAFRMSIPYAWVDGDSQRVDRNTPIVVPRGAHKLELDYEVLNYTIQEPNIGFMMEGFDDDWAIVSHSSLSSIVYSNLPSGTYTFHLAVFDSTQENILAERTYTVEKETELYDHPSFVFYLLTVPMILVGWVTWITLKRRERKMQIKLEEANRSVEMGKQVVRAIANAVDAKDSRTGGHSRRVAKYSKEMAKVYGLSDAECREIEWSANMHDIGKIAISDLILNKNSRLTDEEYGIMKTHTTEGAKILSGFTLLNHAVEGAEYHHERYDGKGYPKGLKGEEIPLFARIIGVADAFDAMTANRVYRKQMDFGYVLGELEKGRGTQFDPVFVDILLKLINDGVIDLNILYGIKPEGEAGRDDANQPGAGPASGNHAAEKPESTEKAAASLPSDRPETGKEEGQA